MTIPKPARSLSAFVEKLCDTIVWHAIEDLAADSSSFEYDVNGTQLTTLDIPLTPKSATQSPRNGTRPPQCPVPKSRMHSQRPKSVVQTKPGTPLTQPHVHSVPKLRTISACSPSRSQALRCTSCGIRDVPHRKDVYAKINPMYPM
jgi:hypothetical protein